VFGISSAIAAVLACLWLVGLSAQSLRVARAKPVVALRYE